MKTTEKFLGELKSINQKINEYINDQSFEVKFNPTDVREGVYLYLNRPAKSLRPGILNFSCGAVGGNPESVLPAAAAIEVFHNWTLVHDDIIDNDNLRRGGDTVHTAFEKKALKRGYSKKEAAEYGRNVAILVGDILHSFSISLMTNLYLEREFDPAIVVKLINILSMKMNAKLIEGEMIDVQLAKKPIEELKEKEVIKMMMGKTGAMFEYSAMAGAMLGLDTTDENNSQVKSLANFACKCGIAFQLQDDVLGIIGDEKKLGKAVGSDIKEGKRTLIVWQAFRNANEIQKNDMLKSLGNAKLKKEDISRVSKLLVDLGGVDYVRVMAKKYIENIVYELDNIPNSKYKDLLGSWADFMINRSL